MSHTMAGLGRLSRGGVSVQDLEERKAYIAAGIFMVVDFLRFIDTRIVVQRGYGTCSRSPKE